MLLPLRQYRSVVLAVLSVVAVSVLVRTGTARVDAQGAPRPAEEAATRIDLRAQAAHYPAITAPGVLWHGVARAYELLEGRAQ